jgi:aminopeptidase N
VRFHGADGRGYRFLAQAVLELNASNPQIAARLVGLFNHWRRFDVGRSALMEAQLQHIAAQPDLSKDVYEIVSRALGR